MFARSDAHKERLLLHCAVCPGENAAQLSDRLTSLLEALGVEPCYREARPSFKSFGTDALCARLSHAARNHGIACDEICLDGWTEAAMLADAGIPTIVFGAGGGGAHTTSEWVDLRQVELAAAILQDTVQSFQPT